jgi:hypothetical protein
MEPLPIQRFAPSSTQPPGSRRAVVSSATESEPWAGSVTAKAPIAFRRALAGSQRSCCSSLPSRSIVHREPRLDAEERAEAAVAAVKLHVDEARASGLLPGQP